MIRKPANSPGFGCFECQSGLMKLRFVTYFTWIDNEMITVPDFPAWVCDVCGNSVFDQKAINVISTILNPSTGRPSRHPETALKKGTDNSQPSQTEQ